MEDFTSEIEEETSLTSDRIFIVYDTEGTGLQKSMFGQLNSPAPVTARGSEVCQIGGIILDDRMVPQKLFCHYCDTVAADSPNAAYKVHGISQRDVRRYLLGQFLPEIITQYLPEFLYPNVIFIGYNVEFDMTLVAQSLSNSPIDWKWTPLKASIVPRRGRHSVDVGEYVKKGDRFCKLASFSDELATRRLQFLTFYEKRLPVQTNCIELLRGTWEHEHNAFFDAVNTFLLWGDRVWKKKLV